MPFDVEFNGKTYSTETKEDAEKLANYFATKHLESLQSNTKENSVEQSPQTISDRFAVGTNVGLRSSTNQNEKTQLPDLYAALKGALSGASLNQAPNVLGLLNAQGKGRPEWQQDFTQSQNESPLSYMAGYVLGSVYGAPAKVGGALLGAGEGLLGSSLISRLITNAAANAGVDVLQSIGNKERVGESAGIAAGQSLLLDTLLGAAGKGAQLLSKTDRYKNFIAKEGYLHQPNSYNERVIPDVIEAQKGLKNQTGVDIQLAPEQILQDPNLLELGVSNKTRLAQEKGVKEIAQQLELNAGVPSGAPASYISSKIGYIANAPRIDRAVLSEGVADSLTQAKTAFNDKYEQAFGVLNDSLKENGSNTFAPKILNSEIQKIRGDLKAGTGITDKGVIEFLDAMKEGRFTEAIRNKEYDELLGAIPEDYLQMQGKLIEASGINPNIEGKTSLLNLFKLRQEATALGFDAKSESSKMALDKIKSAIDSEVDTYAKQVGVKNPELAKQIIDTNNAFKSDIATFENPNIKAIIKKADVSDPLNVNLPSIDTTISSAFAKGDINTIKSLDRLLPPQKMVQIKQGMIQDILRGKNAMDYDFNGLRDRMDAIKSDEAKQYLFGNDWIKYENLATISKHIENSLDYVKSHHLPPPGADVSNPGAWARWVGFAASRFNNHPAIVEMLTRQNKKIISNSAASLLAKRFVSKLVSLDAASNGQDSSLNQTQGE